MSKKLTICPACNAELKGGVCMNCGYVQIIFPGEVPESLKMMEKNRLKAIKEMISQKKMAEDHCVEIENKLKSVEEQLLQMKNVASPSRVLRGVVIISNKKNLSRGVLPVYEGKNSYGSDKDNGYHREIKFRILGFQFQPIHFYVYANKSGLVLEAAPGAHISRKGGEEIATPVTAIQSDLFNLSEKVEINIVSV
jgi:hypothetical protein